MSTILIPSAEQLTSIVQTTESFLQYLRDASLLGENEPVPHSITSYWRVQALYKWGTWERAMNPSNSPLDGPPLSTAAGGWPDWEAIHLGLATLYALRREVITEWGLREVVGATSLRFGYEAIGAPGSGEKAAYVHGEKRLPSGRLDEVHIHKPIDWPPSLPATWGKHCRYALKRIRKVMHTAGVVMNNSPKLNNGPQSYTVDPRVPEHPENQSLAVHTTGTGESLRLQPECFVVGAVVADESHVVATVSDDEVSGYLKQLRTMALVAPCLQDADSHPQVRFNAVATVRQETYSLKNDLRRRHGVVSKEGTNLIVPAINYPQVFVTFICRMVVLTNDIDDWLSNPTAKASFLSRLDELIGAGEALAGLTAPNEQNAIVPDPAPPREHGPPIESADQQQSARHYLMSWAEIADVLGRKNTRDERRRIGRLNSMYSGPIVMPKRGGQPKVDRAKLLAWWESLEVRFVASQQADANKGATVRDSYAYGRAEVVVPGLAGHIKKRRKKAR